MNTIKKYLLPGAVATAAVIGFGGGALMNTLSANAATTPSTTDTAATTADTSTTTPSSQGGGSGGPGGGQGGGGPHTANGITETALTGSDATQAEDAAKAAEPGATVVRAETDADGAKYEVHMQKSDGSMVTVKLDSNFKVTGTENGM